MKNSKVFLKEASLVGVYALIFCVVAIVCSTLINSVTDLSTPMIKSQADYQPQSDLEWYNFFEEDTEWHNKNNDLKKYSAIVNAYNGIFYKYEKELKNPKKDSETIYAQSSSAKAFAEYDYPQLKLLEYEVKSEENYFEVEISNLDNFNQKISEVDSQIEDLVEKVNKEISIINKYRDIHDWLVENVEYDYRFADIVTGNWYDLSDQDKAYYTESNSANIYGAIVEKFAVCTGISEAYKYICSKCNLECLVVTGQTDEGGHAWNIVSIYGRYFLVDCTWDIITNQSAGSYMVNDEEESVKRLITLTKYDYFLVTNSKCDDRTIKNEKIDEFLKQNQQKWNLNGNEAISDSGIKITLPSDYTYLDTSNDSLIFALTSEGYDKLFAGEDVDSLYLHIENAKIDSIILLDNMGKKVEGILNYIEGKEYLYSENFSSHCIIVMNCDGEMYTVETIRSGM